MTAQLAEPGVPTRLPDFDMQAVVFKVLREHPRPVFHAGGFKVSCSGTGCEWGVPLEGSRNSSNQRRFHRHQSHMIETAVTAWLDEEDAA